LAFAHYKNPLVTLHTPTCVEGRSPLEDFSYQQCISQAI